MSRSKVEGASADEDAEERLDDAVDPRVQVFFNKVFYFFIRFVSQSFTVQLSG